MSEVYQYLKNLEIPYKEFKHKAVFTVQEAEEVEKNIPGVKTKSLFLRDKNKKRYILFCLNSKKRADIKQLAKKLNLKHPSFASSEDLEKFLKVKPGSVSPFGILNDQEHQVELLIDKEILEGDSVNFHPNDNRFTINLKPKAFKKFLNSLDNKFSFF
jgi:Ala-tRNA(Pro) deacylase